MTGTHAEPSSLSKNIPLIHEVAYAQHTKNGSTGKKREPVPLYLFLILESATVFEGADSSAAHALYSYKAGAMSAVLEWISGGDFTYETFDAMVVGVADIDMNGEISDGDEQDYNMILNLATDVLVRFGANKEGVGTFINDENDAEGLKLGGYLKTKMNDIKLLDNKLVTGYAGKPGFVFECAENDPIN